MFSDAVAEFSDSGTNSRVGEPLKNAQEPATNVEKVAKDDPSINKSLKDGGIAGNSGPKYLLILAVFSALQIMVDIHVLE